ncbi:uncharacterized protein LOC133345962 [Lethenteron reissneri]|uniref:uncharacterized protein LOC133345962 n=1 Tax=Lethenteron reissneri TaxID=7753 RepID=UPI002AB67F8F|nr:uncharacterized protein LOC133345962 [Lethenteron reissneri]
MMQARRAAPARDATNPDIPAASSSSSSSSCCCCWEEEEETLPSLCWVPAGGPVTEARLEEILVESFSHLSERRTCDCASCTTIVSLLSHLVHNCHRLTTECTICHELCQLMRRHALGCTRGSLCPVLPCPGLSERLARRAALGLAEVPGWEVSRDLEFVREEVAPLLSDGAFRPRVSIEFDLVADAEINDATDPEQRANSNAAVATGLQGAGERLQFGSIRGAMAQSTLKEESGRVEPEIAGAQHSTDPELRRTHPSDVRPLSSAPSQTQSGIASIFLPPLCEAVEMISPMEQLMFGLNSSTFSNSEDSLLANQENIQAMLMYINEDFSNSGVQLPDVIQPENTELNTEAACAPQGARPSSPSSRVISNGDGRTAKADSLKLRKSDSLPLSRTNRAPSRPLERRTSNYTKAVVRSHTSLRAVRSVCLSAVPVSVRARVCVGESRELRELTVHWESLGPVSDSVCEGILLNKELSPIGGSYREGQQWEKTPRQLGRGRFGNVFVGRDLCTSFHFAVKQLSVDKFSENELSIWSRLDSLRLVQLYGAVREGPRLSLFMQVAEGGTLDVMISDNKQLPQDLAMHYTCQVLEALEYLHQNNVLHGDVKADNILMSADGNQVWLCDFGFSQLLPPGSKVLPKDQQPRGTQTHMAPEVAASAGHDCKADVWSACCVLLHMLNGRHPWMGRFAGVKVLYFVIVQQEAPVNEAPEWCTSCVLDVLRSGLQKDAAARPTASLLLSQARSALDELGGLDTAFSFQECTSSSILVSGSLTGRLVSLINRRASANAGSAQLGSLGQRSLRASSSTAPLLNEQAPPPPQPLPQSQPRWQPEVPKANPASLLQPPQSGPPATHNSASAQMSSLADVKQTFAMQEQVTLPSLQPRQCDQQGSSQGPETVSDHSLAAAVAAKETQSLQAEGKGDGGSPRPEGVMHPQPATDVSVAGGGPVDGQETAEKASRAGATRHQTRTLISVDALENSILGSTSLGPLPGNNSKKLPSRKSPVELACHFSGRSAPARQGKAVAVGATSSCVAAAVTPAAGETLEGGAELREEPLRFPLRRMPGRHSDPQADLDDMQRELVKQLSVPNPTALHDALLNSLIAEPEFMPFEDDAESIHSLPESPQLPSTVHLQAVRVNVLGLAGEHEFTLLERVGVTVEEVAIGIKERVALPTFTLTWPDGTEMAQQFQLREPSVALRYVAAGDAPGLAWTWRVNGGHLEKRPPRISPTS